MTTYLFVTDEENHPESVESGKEKWWSCSSTTRINDTALVYVKGQGIVYQWRVTSDAERHSDFPFVCDVEHQHHFEPPISLQEIRALFPRQEWPAADQNFRGYTSIIIPPYVAKELIKSRASS